MPVLGPIFGEGPTQTTTSPVVVEGIQKLDQLATVRWTESVVVTKETSGGALKQALAGEKVVLVVTGDVEAGVDLSSMKDGDVRVDGKRVEIRLPDPEILEDKILVAAQKNGIRDTADQNAEDSIRAFVTSLGFEEVRFE